MCKVTDEVMSYNCLFVTEPLDRSLFDPDTSLQVTDVGDLKGKEIFRLVLCVHLSHCLDPSCANVYPIV